MVQQLQALGAQPLETVRAGAGLEGTTPQNAGPGGLHPPGHQGDLLLTLHAAGTGHHGKVAAANFDLAAHFHHGIIGMELAVGLLVGLRHAAAGIHHRVGQNPALAQRLGVADEAQNVGIAAHGVVDLKAHALEFGAEILHLIGGGALF